MLLLVSRYWSAAAIIRHKLAITFAFFGATLRFDSDYRETSQKT